MGAYSSIKRTAKWFVGIAIFVFCLPLVLAALLVPFFGGVPVTIVFITYVHLFMWPFGVADDLGDDFSYNKVLERSSVFECLHIAVSLEPHVQTQPFSRSDQDFDWQPRVGGPPEAQPVGQEKWLPTPIEEEQALERAWEMEQCGLSAEAITAATTAMTEPGSWVAYSTRGMDKVFLYSHPLRMALVFSNET